MGFQPDGGGSAVTQTLKEASVTLSAAQIVALNSTPILVASAPGAGKYIELISASAIIETYGGTPYATNTVMVLQFVGSGYRAAFNSAILASTVARATSFTVDQTGTVSALQIVPNANLVVSVQTGNPTNAGTGSVVKVKVLYREVTI